MKSVIITAVIAVVISACGAAAATYYVSGTRSSEPQTVVKETTVYRTQTETAQAQAPAGPSYEEQAPAGPSYDEVWNRCYQAGENDIDQYYTSSDLAAYCRQLAASVGDR
jgi:hypothetical protein